MWTGRYATVHRVLTANGNSVNSHNKCTDTHTHTDKTNIAHRHMGRLLHSRVDGNAPASASLYTVYTGHTPPTRINIIV